MTHKISLQCPIPISEYPQILLAHGGGGRLMHQLIDKIFTTAFAGSNLQTQHDSAVLSVPSGRLAFTTDAYVVHPIFFPGGDIGSLSIYGTVNDLAMCGARPLYISVAFIIEEGFSIESLWRVALSMKRAADNAGIAIVTGDTKVVDRGHGHELFITTSGVGEITHALRIEPASVCDGDAIVLSGDIGRHGMAIMAAREGLRFESTIASDCAPLNHSVQRLLDAGIEIHCLRDLTRGGLASALVEIALTARLHFTIDEVVIPVRDDVRGACEILGFDPLYVANEGRFVVFVPKDQAARTVTVLENSLDKASPIIIGRVQEDSPGLVTARSILGAERIIGLLSGEQLPRIC